MKNSPATMRLFLKTFGFELAWLLRSTFRVFMNVPEVVVLMYHAIDDSGWKLSVTPEEFDRQMNYLAKKRLAVRLDDVVDYVKNENKLPSRAVAVTFDDGYRDLLTTVLPTITKYKIPITIFIPSETSVKNGERAKRDVCAWEEIRVLQRTNIINIESHSRTHAHLSRLSSDELTEEIEGSANDIERETGVRPRYFAYPYGERTPEIESEAIKSYIASFGITEGLIHQGDDLYRLKRVQIDGTMSFLLFRLRLTGAIEWNRRIVNFIRSIFHS